MKVIYLFVLGAIFLDSSAASLDKFDVWSVPSVRELFYYPLHWANVTQRFLRRHTSKMICMKKAAGSGQYNFDKFKATTKLCTGDYNDTLDLLDISDVMVNEELSEMCTPRIKALIRGQSCGQNAFYNYICATVNSGVEFTNCFEIPQDPEDQEPEPNEDSSRSEL